MPADLNGRAMFYTLFSQLSYQFPKLSEGGAQEFHYGGTRALLLWFEDNYYLPRLPSRREDSSLEEGDGGE